MCIRDRYYSDKLPLAPYTKPEDTRTAAAKVANELVTAGGITEAKITDAVQKTLDTALKKALLDITNHQIQQIWMHGLDKPARDAAKAEYKRLTLPQLFRHVDRFAPEASKKNDSGNQHKGKKKISEVEDNTEDDGEIEEVKRGSNPPSKFCNYCRRRGHVIADCLNKKNGTSGANKGKGAAVNKFTNGQSNSNVKTFADQERARFNEYINRAFAVYSKSNPGANEIDVGNSSALSDPLLYPQGF